MKPLPRTCVMPGCKNRTYGSRCEVHERQNLRELNVRKMANPDRWVYRDPRWKKVRAVVLAEEPRCRRCGALAEHVDHIVPVSAGGAAFRRSNLQALCASCNASKMHEDNKSRRKA